MLTSRTAGTSSLKTNDVIVFPNPATDLVYIKATNPENQIEIQNNGAQVEIMNNLSAIIKKDVSFGELEISELSSGIYFFTISLKNQIPITFKIVKL